MSLQENSLSLFTYHYSLYKIFVAFTKYSDIMLMCNKCPELYVCKINIALLNLVTLMLVCTCNKGANIHTQRRMASIFLPPLPSGNSKMRYPPCPQNSIIVKPPPPRNFPFFVKPFGITKCVHKYAQLGLF